MKLRNLVFLTAALFAVQVVPASAGIYSDAMAKCLVSSTTPADKALLVKWIFSALALHPAVQPLSAIAPETRKVLNKDMAGLFQRLMTKDCRTETVTALEYEGTPALQSSFTVLGQVAARTLMTNPKVSQGLAAMNDDMDNEKMAALLKEAGIAPADGAKAKAAGK